VRRARSIHQRRREPLVLRALLAQGEFRARAVILYLIGGLLALSVFTGVGGYFKGRSDMADNQREEIAALAETARLRERAATLAASRDQEKRDATNSRINARLVAALGELRSRPERLSAASAAACAGGDGAGLSGPDAGFLEGEAARANKLRADLETAKEWIKRATEVTQ
jgi:hypothetical protein